MAEEKDKKHRRDEKESSGATRKVIIRNVYAKAQYRKFIMVFWLSFVSMIISVLALFMIVITPIPPRYIAITPSGALLQEKPLSDGSSFDDGDILEFSLQAVKRINTYDFLNYKYQWQEEMDVFTDNGWKRYAQQIVDTQLVNAIDGQKIISTFTLSKPPVIADKKVGTDGVYKWIVFLPGTITYFYNVNKNGDSATEKNEIQTNIKLYIVRTKLAENPRGIAVDVYSVLQ